MPISKPSKEIVKSQGAAKGILNISSRPIGRNGMKQYSYYLTDEIVAALQLRKMRTGHDLSSIVRSILEKDLKKEIETLKQLDLDN